MCAAITTSAIGLGLAGFQAYQGMKSKEAGEDALANFKRQDLTNPYEDLPISTVGSDMIREESGRTSANAVDALRNADSRVLLGGIPQVVSATNRANKEGQLYLDDQVNKRNYAIANDKAETRGMQENRDNSDLAGIGQQIEVGRQDMWNGFRGMGAAAMYGANSFSGKTTGTSGTSFKPANLPKDIGYNPNYYPYTNSVPNLQGGY
jgi:hypothetical protein